MAEIDKLIAELNKDNVNLKKLIEENTRLNETIFEKTGKERVEELIRRTDEYNEILKKVIDAINSDLGTSINVDNISDSLKSLKESINNTKDSYESLRETYNESKEELKQLKNALKNATDPALITRLTDKINDLTDEITAQEDELKNSKELLEKNEKAYNLLNESASNFYSAANEEQKELNKRQLEGITALDDWGEKWEQRTRAVRKGAGEVSNGVKQIYNSITKTLEPWAKANHEAMAYAKSMGMSQRTADAYLEKTVSWAAKNNIGILFNKTTDELIKMQGKYSEVLGRNVQLTNEQKKDMLAMETFLGEDGMMDIANNLENFGLGMSDSADFIKETMDDATKSGIAASKLTKTIRENIKMAQNYTFKDGLKGLESMAKKAIELKTDMSLINGFLEKTSTVEGAITTGAQLQVLGGSYAVGSDPLSMLYESLSDAEGLFDRATGMAKGKVFYNEETGNFEMGAMDRYMMKQAATAMGIDPNKMLDVAFRDASLSRIEGQARMNSNISGDEDMMSLIKNLATWDKGRAVVNIDGKDVDVKDITAEDKEKLEAMQRTDSQNLQEMAISLRSMNEIMSGTEKEINNEQAKATHGIAQKLDNMLGNSTEMLDIVAKIGAWANILGGVGGVLAGVWSTSAGVWRMGRGIGNLVGNGTPMGRGGFGPGGVGAGGAGVGAAAPVNSGVLRNGFTRTDFRGGLRQTTYTSSTGNVYRNLGSGRLQNVNTGRVIGGRAASNVMATGVKSSGWTNLAKAAGKGLKVGGATALLGGAISLGTDIATGEFKKDKGGSIGRAAGTTAGALLGGVLGGPVGAAIGGWLGSVVTEGIQKAQKENRAKIRSKIAADLASSMPQLSKIFEGDNAIQGNYNESQLKELQKALSDNTISEGELSVNLVDKLRANQDLERMRDQGVNVQIGLDEGGDIVKNNGYATAIPTSSQSKGYLDASNTIIGQSHASGGIHVQDSNINVQGGEKVMTREAVKRYGVILNAMNDGANFKIIPIEPMGKISKVSPNHTSQGASMPHNTKIEIPPVSINLKGTIKLDLGKNKEIDITDKLLDDTTFITKITEMISKEINRLENKAFRKNSFKQKFA